MIIKRNITATVMASAMSTVMAATVLNRCGGTPKETTPGAAKEQKAEARIADTTGEGGRDEESGAEAASGSYEDKTIGFVGMILNNEYHITLANGAKVETETEGVRTEVQAGDWHASVDAQFGIIENMIASEVDGILLAPNSSDGLESALAKRRKIGIPIINLDMKLTDKSLADAGLNIPFCGTNNYEGAKLAGKYVVKDFEKGTKTAILKGIEGQTNAADRYNGFMEGTRDTIAVMAEQTTNWEMDQGYTAAQNVVSANPDAKLLFCCSDNMGIGALRAIKEASMQEQIQIIRFDAVSEVLNLVENGKFLATAAQCPAEMGKLGVDNILKIFDSGEAESYIDTGAEVITKDNVGEFKDYLKTFEQGQGQSLAKGFSYGVRTHSRP